MKIRPEFTRHGVAWEFLLSNIFDIGIPLWEKTNFYHTDHKVIKTLLVSKIVLDKSSWNLYIHTKAKSQMNNGDLFFLNVSESVEITEYKDERLNHENRKLLNIWTKNHTFNF